MSHEDALSTICQKRGTGWDEGWCNYHHPFHTAPWPLFFPSAVPLSSLVRPAQRSGPRAQTTRAGLGVEPALVRIRRRLWTSCGAKVRCPLWPVVEQAPHA